MRLVIRPIQDQHRELDVTHRLVSAIAEEIWQLYGENEQLNWIEAERHLRRLVGEARAGAHEMDVALAPAEAPAVRLGRADRAELPTPDPAIGRGTRTARPEHDAGPSRRTGPKETKGRRTAAGALT